jgi:hypothetical protein
MICIPDPQPYLRAWIEDWWKGRRYKFEGTVSVIRILIKLRLDGLLVDTHSVTQALICSVVVTG